VSDQAPRIGVYVCHCGGNISDVVDCRKVVEAAARLENVTVAREYEFMCSDPGQKLIEEDIEKEGLDRVVVAACSPSLHELTFRTTLSRAGLNPYLYDHANIREQVSWVTKSDPDGATDKATRLVAAAVAKAALQTPLEPLRVEARRHVAVVGGGVAGLTCARDLARRGLEVSLIEKSDTLGGRTLDLGRVFPTEEDAHDLIRGLLEEVTQESRIHVHTSAELTAASGSVGSFTLTLRDAEAERTIEAGAIVLATGFDSYQPSRGEFGFEEHRGVITLPDLVRRLDRSGPTEGGLSENGRPVKNVCMIHCVGSRQLEGVHEPGADGSLNTHCSRTCCTATLRAANEIRERFPDVNVYDVHQDIRTYGHGHEEYYENASRGGVLFFRHRGEEPPVVRPDDRNDGSSLLVSVKDTLTFDEEIDIPADLVVLATGMVPRDIGGLVEMLKLPRSPDGFLQEVHPKLRPVEMAVDGVLLAGSCQAPMDITESCASAGAAAAKAAALLAKGYIELDPFFVEIEADSCDGCSICIEECRFVHALTPDEATAAEDVGSVPLIDPALCRGCGMCSSVCPTGAIQVRGWRVSQYDAMVDAILAGSPVSGGNS
jgi:heterodisulfide reductase subunit A2